MAPAAALSLIVERKRLVVDANILIRGCLGMRVRSLIASYSDQVDFFVAEANAAEAADYFAALARKRGLDEKVCRENNVLESARQEALARIRDPADWPALALALQLDCAIWTEDQDFFGSGVPTWTSQTVELYLDS
jgi:predicted nucleic acid-binding protein